MTERLVPLGATLPGTTTLTASGDQRKFTFSFDGPVKVAYELDLTHPDVRAGRLTIEETVSGKVPIAGAGLLYRRQDGSLDDDPRLIDAKNVLLLPTVSGKQLSLSISEQIEGVTHRKLFTFRSVGAALEVGVRSTDAGGPANGAYAGITTGVVEGSNDGVNVRVPFMESVPITMLDHKWFAGSLLEPPRSHASLLVPEGPQSLPGSGFKNGTSALYSADTGGNVRPISETLWVVVSPTIDHLFPVPDAPPAPGRAEMSDRAHVLFGAAGAGNTFETMAALVGQWATWGVTNVLAVLPAWQEPSSLPPNIGPPAGAAGGPGGLMAFAQRAHVTGARLLGTVGLTVTASACGGGVNGRYREGDRVVDGAGQPRALADDANGWACTDGTTNTAYLLATDAAETHLSEQLAALAGWGLGGLVPVDLGSQSPAFPWPGASQNALDSAPGGSHPHDVGAAVAAVKALLARAQASLGPSVAGVGPSRWPEGYDSFYAGYVDGGLRAPAGGADDVAAAGYLVVPDYELRVVRRRMVGYGLGTYGRFFGPTRFPGPALPPTATVLSEDELDAWRARELAYGHAGAWEAAGGSVAATNRLLGDADIVKEYFLTQGLQHRYLADTDVSVGYSTVEATEVDLSAALQRDMDLSSSRLHLRYGASGQFELYVNLSSDPWTLRLPGGNLILPNDGWLARQGGSTIGFSALVGGRHVDWLKLPEFELADGRGLATDFGGFAATHLVVQLADGRRIEEQADGSLVVTP